jgi:radical SAM protein with 4Fe4S-binding SPASM domain
VKPSLLKRVTTTFQAGGVKAIGERSRIFLRRRFYRVLAPLQQMNAEVSGIDIPKEVVAACMYKARVKIYNRSHIIWNATGSKNPTFAAAAIIVGKDGETYEAEQAPLPRDLKPGSSCEIDVSVEIPRKPGKYTLRVDIVRENCYWFTEIGRVIFETPILVTFHSVPLFASRIPAIDITLDITNKCPLKCIQCRKTYFETFDEQRDMNFDLFKKISAEVFPHARSVTLSSAGEPLMTKNLFDAVDITRSYNVPQISFISAGFHLNPGRAEKIVDNGVTRVEFSIDGASAAVYNKIRIGSDFDKVIKNITYLSEYKKKKKSRTPLLRFNYVLMKNNIHELPAFIDLAAKLGVEEVQCQHMVIFVDGIKEEALVFDKERSNQYISEAKTRASRHGIRFYHPPLFDIGEQHTGAKVVLDGKIWQQEDQYDYERKTHPILQDGMQLCTDPWRKLYIDWQGQVFPCCVWKEEPLGDLKKSSFLEIWESVRYRELRNGLTTGKLGKSCAECSVITGGDVNSEQSYFFGQN